MTNIFERILYGLKIANDNIVILSDKLDEVLKAFNYEEVPEQREPNDAPAPKIIGGVKRS